MVAQAKKERASCRFVRGVRPDSKILQRIAKEWRAKPPARNPLPIRESPGLRVTRCAREIPTPIK